jgi:hypothetical protein
MEIRKLCRAVKAAGSILVRDFPRVGGTAEASTKLEKLELMTIQHVLMCKKNSNMVLQVANLDGLPELDLQGVRCPSCGRKPSEERAEQVLVPTEICKDLLDHSKWMAVTLSSALENLGIPNHRILLEYQEGAEEIDAFIDVEGKLLLIELKDKDFSMGQAYALSTRIALYRPEFVRIVTAEKVSPEVRGLFDRLKPETDLAYIEGLDSLTDELGKIVDSVRGERAASIIKDFGHLTVFENVPSLICAKLGIEPRKKLSKRLVDLAMPSALNWNHFYS